MFEPINPKAVVRRWSEQAGEKTWYYVEHVRDGKTVISYSNYDDPLDSQATPWLTASSLETSLVSPLTFTDAEE